MNTRISTEDSAQKCLLWGSWLLTSPRSIHGQPCPEHPRIPSGLSWTADHVRALVAGSSHRAHSIGNRILSLRFAGCLPWRSERMLTAPRGAPEVTGPVIVSTVRGSKTGSGRTAQSRVKLLDRSGSVSQYASVDVGFDLTLPARGPSAPFCRNQRHFSSWSKEPVLSL